MEFYPSIYRNMQPNCLNQPQALRQSSVYLVKWHEPKLTSETTDTLTKTGKIKLDALNEGLMLKINLGERTVEDLNYTFENLNFNIDDHSEDEE